MWARDEVSSCNCSEKSYSMYTADACVATEKQPLERRNRGIGQKLDYVLKVLQALLDLIILTQMRSRIPRQLRWISTEKGLTHRSY